MAQDKQPTRIVLRRFKNHYRQIIALMPDIQADYQGNIESYMHVGQHSAAAMVGYCLNIGGVLPPAPVC